MMSVQHTVQSSEQRKQSRDYKILWWEGYVEKVGFEPGVKGDTIR